MTDKDGDAHEDPNYFPSDYPEVKPYAFNGRVVMGIGLVLAVAAGGTIFAMSVSQSPQIALSVDAIDKPEPSALAQNARNSEIDREIVLIANNFGWNGTESGPIIRVTEGETIELTVINAGNMAHNFGIANVQPETRQLMDNLTGVPLTEKLDHLSYNDVSKHPCPDCEPVFHEAHIDRLIMPGDQHVVTFTAENSGQFKYFCMVRSHLWLGMNSDIIVEPRSEITTPSPELVEEA